MAFNELRAAHAQAGVDADAGPMMEEAAGGKLACCAAMAGLFSAEMVP